MRRALLSILLMLILAPALAQTTPKIEGCITCIDVQKVLGLMNEVVAGPDRARTARMLRLVVDRYSAVCRTASDAGETLCEMASAKEGERLVLSMTLDDDRRMAERSHFLWLRMKFQTPRPEKIRELGNALGPGWHFGQSMKCLQDVWRPDPVTRTFTRIEIRGKWQDGSKCEDHIDAVELLTTTGNSPAPRVF